MLMYILNAIIATSLICVENVEIPAIEIPGKFVVTGQNITITGKCERCQ